MPSLFRFLTILAALGGVCVAAMLLVVMLVEPQPREMSIVVPPAKLAK